MDDSIAAWHAEHVHYAHLLDLLEDELAVFHANGIPDYPLMRDIVAYLQHAPDRHHHPREDAAFARLIDRMPTYSMTISRIVQEHRVIHVAGEELLGKLEAIVADSFVAREVLEAAAATFVTYYRHHIATEETEIMPVMRTALTERDWQAVEEAIPLLPDPRFGDGIEQRYRAMNKRVAARVRRRPRPTEPKVNGA